MLIDRLNVVKRGREFFSVIFLYSSEIYTGNLIEFVEALYRLNYFILNFLTCINFIYHANVDYTNFGTTPKQYESPFLLIEMKRTDQYIALFSTA